MPTDYLVFCFAGDPVFNALPIMKVTHYPYEPESYKPFAQGLLCMHDDALIARLWAFESKPEAVSTLALSLKGPNERTFTLSVALSGAKEALLDGAPCTLPLDIHPIAGEDLQGEYWGIDLVISAEITAALAIDRAKKGTLFNGNMYKLCEGIHPHFGSFFPAGGRNISACPATFELTPF